MTEEMWKDIKGFEDRYQISSEGRVRSLARKFIDNSGRWQNIKERILKLKTDKDGYKVIGIRDDSGKQKYFRVHRLVCEAFIPNPDDKPQVNHIDEDKSNNRICNLEWCTCTENNNHGTRTARAIKNTAKALSKMVGQYTLDGELVKVFQSTHEAERQTGFNHQNISAVANGKSQTAYNYIWRYISGENDACNLEISVSKELRKSARGKGLSKTVAQYTLDNELVKVWNSPIEAEREGGFNRSNISKVALGKQKAHKGYIWKYVSQ